MAEQIGLQQTLNSYLEQLKQSPNWEELSDLGIQEMVALMQSAFTETESTALSIADQVRILTTTWESALKPGGMTSWHFGVLSAALNSVDPDRHWTVQQGKRRNSVQVGATDNF